MLLFSFEQFSALAKKLLEFPVLDPGKFIIGRYHNREMHAKIFSLVKAQECFVLGTIAPPEHCLLEVLLLAETLKKAGAASVIAILPYLAYSRHDKAKPEESMATQLIGEMLKASGVDEVWTVDLHSQRDRQLFPVPIISLATDELFAQAIKEHLLSDASLVAPDNGAVPRCAAVQQALGLSGETVYFEKHRDASGKIIHQGPVGALKGKAVIIDDMLDTGETLVATCEKLKAARVKEIYIFVSHGLFTGKAWKKLWRLNVKAIFCTDTISPAAHLQSKKITVLPIARLLEQQFERHMHFLSNDKASGGVEIGIDTEEAGLTERAGAIYPAAPGRHFGVDTSRGTDPAETDQGDEEYEGKLWGTPDDLASRYGEEQKEKFVEELDND